MSDEADAMARKVTEGARKATESVSGVARDAARRIDESRSTAADGLETAASTIHDRASALPGGEKVREFAHAAADRLSTGADYVRSHDASRMMADVETLVKNNPGPALAVAAAFGFMVGRALSRD
jgi:ElaB/YqjD/DUF883 family membrane-anchored ribosome-binding protein